MTKILQHITLMFSLIAAMLFAACSSEESEPVTPETEPEGYMIRLLAPGYYDEGTQSRALTEDIIDGLDIRSFADGTTMWVLVEQKVPNPEGGFDEDGNPDSIYVQEPLNTSYAIRRTTLELNGSKVTVAEMVPCNCDEEGNFIDYKSGHLYLTPGVYRIRAVSPAKKLDNGSKMTILNGMQVLSTDYRYRQTRPGDLRIYEVIQEADGTISDPNSNNGIVVYNLASMINQTARIEFNISVDDDSQDYISKVEPLYNGCELTGLYAADEYNWTSVMDEITEPIHSYLDKKDDKFTITEDYFTHTDGDPTRLSCGVCILPMNASSTTLLMTFNLRVNNAPTQFMTSITSAQYEHGINYQYNIHLTWNQGVVVAGWYNDSSVIDVGL